MWFDVQRALAEIGVGNDPISISQAASTEPALNRPRVAGVASVATLPARNPKCAEPPQTAESENFSQRQFLEGLPRTWTGGIVSLAEWRQMDEWSRHGPNGRHLSGITRQWERPERNGE